MKEIEDDLLSRWPVWAALADAVHGYQQVLRAPSSSTGLCGLNLYVARAAFGPLF
jgi:hypothetical protein